MRIRPITLPLAGIAALQQEASAEGYRFLDRLVQEWSSGENRFCGPGEVLLGGFEEDELIGIGGLTLDPFLSDARVGRIRRVYVRAAWRGGGVGTRLVSALIERAFIEEPKGPFLQLRLQTENADAARLYERLGFVLVEQEHATHVMRPLP